MITIPRPVLEARKIPERITQLPTQYTSYRYEGAAALKPIQESTDEIQLTAEQEDELIKGIRKGVLMQLHRDGKITDEQLNSLLKQKNK